MEFYKSDNDKKIKYLTDSSKRNYPFASYELAHLYFETGNVNSALSYLFTAEQQNIAMPYINQELQYKINQLKEKIRTYIKIP